MALAIIFAQSRLVERAFYPFAVAMQVTPIVAIAPLLLIYLSPTVAVLVCAFLVAFFPLLANTTLGLSSADHNLVDLFQMYRRLELAAVHAAAGCPRRCPIFSPACASAAVWR